MGSEARAGEAYVHQAAVGSEARASEAYVDQAAVGSEARGRVPGEGNRLARQAKPT